MEDNKDLEGKKEVQNTENTPPPIPNTEETNEGHSIVDKATSTIKETVEDIKEEATKLKQDIVEPAIESVKENVVEPVVEAVKENIVEPVKETVEEIKQEIKEEFNTPPPPTQSPYQNYNQPMYNQPPIQEKNGIGLAGFIISIIAFFLGWIPVFGWILWLLGLIFSAVGIFKKPKGFAIAGLIISLILFIFLIFGFALLATTAALSS
ncbi:hypothetical protein [Myroides sp.]|uniref:hypothetical protein n=1 Tax=Myroides sp. TaxID=1874736 RepID=UPI003F31D29A